MSETKEFDFAVFIGRFQPFHQGHLQVIQSGLEQADKLIVLIGSSRLGIRVTPGCTVSVNI